MLLLNLCIVLQPPGPFDVSKFTVLKAMQCALALEENVNRNLLALHAVAEDDTEVFLLIHVVLKMLGTRKIPTKFYKCFERQIFPLIIFSYSTCP